MKKLSLYIFLSLLWCNVGVAEIVEFSCNVHSYNLALISDEDKQTVHRARRMQKFLSQPFFVAEQFTGTPGRYVSMEDTISGFEAILNGDCDELPENAFMYVGTIDEAIEKAKKMES